MNGQLTLKRAGTGLWAPPGGAKEQGEHPEEAAARELREETGLVPTSPLELVAVAPPYPGRRTKIEGAPLIVDGTRQWVTYVDLDHDADDFLELAKAFVASGGDERRVRVGIGEVATCRMREIVDFGIEWISNNRSTSSGPTA